jgi:hypothetical protein
MPGLAILAERRTRNAPDPMTRAAPKPGAAFWRAIGRRMYEWGQKRT